MILFYSQHKLKGAQRDKVRQFISLTNLSEKAAISCLAQHNWRLDIASDSFFTEPEAYIRETRQSIDKKKLDALYNMLKGILLSCRSYKWTKFFVFG